MNHLFSRLIIALVVFFTASFAMQANTTQNEPVTIQILALNDFHGALMPPSGGKLGGIASISTLVKELKQQYPNTVLVGVGDLIGASPLLSSIFYDEPTIEAFNQLGMAFSVVGNHEFDKGKAELLRKQNGGCHPTNGCLDFTASEFKGADFKYLAANVINEETGKPLFDPYFIQTFGEIKIAFIGVVLEGTPAIVTHSGTQGLTFKNEVEVVNQQVADLKAQGIDNIIVLLHEGASQKDGAKDINGCENLSGKAVDLVQQFDPSVSAVFSGHTHRYYNCLIDAIPFVSGASNGTILSQVLLTINPENNKISEVKVNNIAVDNQKYQPDPELTAFLTVYKNKADDVSKQKVGVLNHDLNRELSENGDSDLGKVVADAALSVMQDPKYGSAQIAFTNSGGLRADLAASEVSFGDLYSVQPFANMLVTKSLTGAQLKALLEQQFDRRNPQVMPHSKGFYYEWNDSKPKGDKIIAESMTLNGEPIKSDGVYRVAANEFLAEGGSHFTVFAQGTDPVYGIVDYEAFINYIHDHSPISKPQDLRLKKVN